MNVPGVFESRPIRFFDFSLDPQQPFALFNNRYTDTMQTSFDRHYEFEVGIVLSGKMHRVFEDYEITLGPGEAWLCGAWEPHGFVIYEAPCEVFGLVVWPEYLHQLEDGDLHLSRPFFAAPSRRPRRVVDCYDFSEEDLLSSIDRVRRKMIAGAPTTHLWTKVLLLQVLTVLSERLRFRAGSKSSEAGEFSTWLNASVRLVFQSNQPVPLADAAKAAGLSVSAFSRCFKNYTGMTFQHFALRHRVDSALHALVASNLPVKAVAAEWGFHDASHFYKSVRRFHNTSLSEYKRSVVGSSSSPGLRQNDHGLFASEQSVQMAGMTFPPQTGT